MEIEKNFQGENVFHKNIFYRDTLHEGTLREDILNEQILNEGKLHRECPVLSWNLRIVSTLFIFLLFAYQQTSFASSNIMTINLSDQNDPIPGRSEENCRDDFARRMAKAKRNALVSGVPFGLALYWWAPVSLGVLPYTAKSLLNAAKYRKLVDMIDLARGAGGGVGGRLSLYGEKLRGKLNKRITRYNRRQSRKHLRKSEIFKLIEQVSNKEMVQWIVRLSDATPLYCKYARRATKRVLSILTLDEIIKN